MSKINKSYDKEIWSQAILMNNASIKSAIENLDKTAMRIVMVVNHNNELMGTISDGDIRRGLLRNINLDDCLENVVNKSPLVVLDNVNELIIEQMMNDNNIHQIPIVNQKKHVIGIHLWDPITSHKKLLNTMIVMAGGFGKRMMPHTKNCPKPMLKIAGIPILEHILVRARAEGVSRFIFIVNYLSHVIEDYFLNGKRWEVNISYIKEEAPLGTVGGLSLVNPSFNYPILVINGDVLTDVRYPELLKFHEEHKADATMAIRNYEWQHPFGIIKTQGVNITSIEEKPLLTSNINAGVYVLNPDCLKLLDKNMYCDMTTLFERLKHKKTIAYPIHEKWSDIGTPEDFINQNKT